MELHIGHVSRTYPNGVQALKDVTLTIRAGMYGLLGPNGAGKSTPQEPDRGIVRFFALPFTFVATAIQFSCPTPNRRPMASYLTSVLLSITSTFASLTLTQRPRDTCPSRISRAATAASGARPRGSYLHQPLA